MSIEEPGRDHDLYDPVLDGGARSKIEEIPSEQWERSGSRKHSLDPVRVRDFVIATIILVLVAPTFVLAIILRRLKSRGPVFSLNSRVGQFGRIYYMYKFNNTNCDWQSKTGPVQPPTGDPRDTPLSVVLSFDAVPGLINVVRGEMSLVGPRPDRPELLDAFRRSLPAYHRRLTVRPGLTGLAQVQLPSDMDIDCVRRRLVLDLLYVSRASFWLDLRIVVAAAGKVLGVPAFMLAALVRVSGAEE